MRKTPIIAVCFLLTLLFIFNPSTVQAATYGVVAPSTVQAGIYDVLVPEGYRPWNLAVDPSNNIWSGANKWEGSAWKGYILKYNVTSYTLSIFSLPDPNPGPILGATIDSDGNIWVCERDAHKIAKLAEEKPTEYAVGSPKDPAYPVAVEANGTDIWIGCAKTANNKIMKFTPDKQTLENYTLPDQYSSSEIRDIKIQKDTVWFTDTRSNYIGELDPTTSKFNFHGPLTSHALFLDIDSQGKVWFTENWANRLGVYDPAKSTITEYFINATGEDTPYGISIDANDDIWFSENLLKKIGKFDHTLETFTEYDVSSKPYDVVKDKIGSLWFIGAGSWHIGRLDPTNYVGKKRENGLEAIVSSKSTTTVGEEFSIRVMIKNTAPETVTNVTVSLSLSNGLTVTNGELKVNIGTLDAGQWMILEWQVKATEAGKCINRLSASGTLIDGSSAYTRIAWRIEAAD